MGYLRKGTAINALRDDRETTLACYEGERERDIIRFCYDCMERELDSLQQYEPESVVEQPKIYDVDKEYANADFEEYAKEVEPCLDAEYDDTFSQGIERAIKILKQEKETVEKHNRTTRRNAI